METDGDCFFFFNDTATTEIYTLSLHDALPICPPRGRVGQSRRDLQARSGTARSSGRRSEEHTSELQSRQYLVCRLLLEKKKKKRKRRFIITTHQEMKPLFNIHMSVWNMKPHEV